MINTNKRKTLKLIAGSGVLAMGSAVYPLLSNASSERVTLTIQHNRNSRVGRLLISNPTAEAVSIQISATDATHSPTGKDCKQPASKRQVTVNADDTKTFGLDELDRFAIKSDNILGDGSHHALRFPIRDNLIIDHVVVDGLLSGNRTVAPVYLTQSFS